MGHDPIPDPGRTSPGIPPVPEPLDDDLLGDDPGRYDNPKHDLPETVKDA